jgi:hypothetical protein
MNVATLNAEGQSPEHQPQDPMGLLVHVLESTLELLSVEENDFSWSSWDGAAAAIDEVTRLLGQARAGNPDWSTLSTLFAPTGPIQEVSLSSGWAEPFLKVAERYDQAFEASQEGPGNG